MKQDRISLTSLTSPTRGGDDDRIGSAAVEAFIDYQCDWLQAEMEARRARLEAMTHDHRMGAFVEAVAELERG